ncbi:hypothetical protein N9782_05505 [Emcibacteraceae bacterium]|jgi:hypothetical protein|nr:hypothetical protein [Emcibacteraceae bacterium]
MLKKIVYSILVIFLISNPAFSKNYKCTIKDIKKFEYPNSSGELKNDTTILGSAKEFVVDRETGRMSGDINNYNAAGEPEVLSIGSKGDAYTAITTYKTGYAQLLNIKEYYDGKQKPFLFASISNIYTGLCIDY